MKPTAKNIAGYVNQSLDKPLIIKGKEYPRGNNIAICLPGLNKNTLEALRNNYGFKSVDVGALGYIRFERP